MTEKLEKNIKISNNFGGISLIFYSAIIKLNTIARTLACGNIKILASLVLRQG